MTTTGHHGSRNTARVKTYGDILLEYEFHPESKCADANGNTCKKQTVGLLAAAAYSNRANQNILARNPTASKMLNPE